MSVFLGSGTGWGYWTALAFGQGSATTDTLVPPTAVAASVSDGTVSVSWDAAVSPDGAPHDGYHVTRVDKSDDTTSDACGTSSWTSTTVLECPQPDGAYHYIVTALHYSWTGVSNPSNPVTVDTTPPNAPSAPDLAASSDSGDSNDDDVTNNATATFTGTAEADSTVRLYSGATLVGTGVATGGNYSITTESALAEGQQTVTAKATDAAGNTSAESAGTLVTVDTVGPTVTVAPQEEQSSATKDQPISFIVTFSEPVSGFSEDDVELTAPAGATFVVTGDGPTYGVAVSGMTADGTVTVAVDEGVAFDLAGNGNDASTGDGTVTRDTTAPATPEAPTLHTDSDTGSSSADGLTNDATPMFTGTAEPAATVTLYEGDTALGSVVAGLDGSWSITSSTLAEGGHTVTVKATDAAGNTSGGSAGTAITIDVTPPAAPSAPDLITGSDSGSSSTDNYTNDTTPTLSGTATIATTVTLYVDDTPAGTFAVTSGTYTFTTETLADAVYTFTAKASDAAGNVSTATAGPSVTIDTTAPTVVITSVTYNNNDEAVVTGTAGYAEPDDDTVAFVICESNNWPCTSDYTVYSSSPTVNATTGAWTRTSGRLSTPLGCGFLGLDTCHPEDTWTRATQSDRAGNTGTSDVVYRNMS